MNKELKDRIVAFRDDRDWKQFHSPKNLAMSISIEAAELMELFQWANDEKDILTSVKEKHSQIEEELADIAIYLLLMSHDLNIDLEQAMANKLKKNSAKYPIEKSKGSSLKYNSES